LEKYCEKWGMTLNLDKSKIVVFRNGGRPGKNEKWWYHGKRVEVVNEYKYLGVTLTSSLSFIPHLNNKLAAAKLGLGSTWQQLVMNKHVTYSSKMKLFNAVSRSVLW
jgi:hypothetical protein